LSSVPKCGACGAVLFDHVGGQEKFRYSQYLFWLLGWASAAAFGKLKNKIFLSEIRRRAAFFGFAFVCLIYFIYLPPSERVITQNFEASDARRYELILQPRDWEVSFNGLNREDRLKVQSYLKSQGYYSMAVDGEWGGGTASAYRAALLDFYAKYEGDPSQILKMFTVRALVSSADVPHNNFGVSAYSSPATYPSEQNSSMGWCIAAGQSPRFSDNYSACVLSGGTRPYLRPPVSLVMPAIEPNRQIRCIASRGGAFFSHNTYIDCQ
jgi:hypothetical protein